MAFACFVHGEFRWPGLLWLAVSCQLEQARPAAAGDSAPATSPLAGPERPGQAEALSYAPW